MKTKRMNAYQKGAGLLADLALELLSHFRVRNPCHLQLSVSTSKIKTGVCVP